MRSLCRLMQGRAGRIARACLITLALLAALISVAVVAVNAAVLNQTKDRVLDLQAAADLETVDLIVVLGAGVKADGTPSDMLHDRVLTAVQLVEAGAEGPVLMSADSEHEDYDEVTPMVKLALSLGMSEPSILEDPLGLSTYESIERVKELYGAKRIVVVTQKYHLYRALYIADRLGLDAYGVSADVRSYRGQLYREAREIAARFKDFIQILAK